MDSPAPRWVKVSLVIALVVAALVVVLMVTGAGGDHGPGRHLGGDAPPAEHTPPPGVEHP